MAQTEQRLIIRRNIKLSEDRYLVFDKWGGQWRVVFYRPRRERENDYAASPAIQDGMQRAGMLPTRDVGYWARFATHAETLDNGIHIALSSGGCGDLHRDVIDYIKATSWAWYLES